MKKFRVIFVVFLSILSCRTSLVHAAEQKIIFNTESIEYKSGTGAKRCLDKCMRKSDPDIQEFLSQGWKIVSSSRKKVIEEEYRYVPCNTCEPHGCTCIGTDYLVQKEEPAPIVGKAVSKRDTPEKYQQSEVLAPKGETSSNELERLRNESILLKNEISKLKQELELLRKVQSKQGIENNQP